MSVISYKTLAEEMKSEVLNYCIEQESKKVSAVTQFEKRVLVFGGLVGKKSKGQR